MSGLVESVALPSGGYLYGDALPDGKVLLRPMSTKEEKLMLSPQQGIQIIDKLIQACLVDCPVPYENFLLGDRNFLLFMLRGITYGYDYSFSVSCTGCNNPFTHNLKIPDDFNIRAFTDKKDAKEYFEVTLPLMGKKLTLRRLCIKDEHEIARWCKQSASPMRAEASMGAEADSYEYRLSRHIVMVDGKEVTGIQALSLFDTMYGKDSLAIRNAIDENDVGLNLMLNVECGRCGVNFQTVVPYTVDFFRPRAAKV